VNSLVGAFSLALAAVAGQAAAAAAAVAQPPAPAASASALESPQCDVRPAYPVGALHGGAQGNTAIEMTFGADGAVATSKVTSASGPTPEHALLDQAALEAMSHCRLAHPETPPMPRRISYQWKLEGGDPEHDPGVQAERERLRQQAAADARLPADAERGNIAAQLALARQYANGDGHERDEKLASKWFRLAAEAGDADAQVYYGQRLMAGKGVSQDDDAGIAWLRKAAARGSGSAAFGLGIFAHAGRGMPASDSVAFHWFLQGAQAGSRAAMLATADAYAKGSGTPHDDAQATRWYLAASPYNMYTVYRLGLAWRDGLGVRVDYERAAFCMALAGKHGETEPTQALATIAPHLDAATLARVRARAEAWQVGQPLFAPD
jgi:TonB family protein